MDNGFIELIVNLLIRLLGPPDIPSSPGDGGNVISGVILSGFSLSPKTLILRPCDSARIIIPNFRGWKTIKACLQLGCASDSSATNHDWMTLHKVSAMTSKVSPGPRNFRTKCNNNLTEHYAG
jgi:hypothetical protein